MLYEIAWGYYGGASAGLQPVGWLLTDWQTSATCPLGPLYLYLMG